MVSEGKAALMITQADSTLEVYQFVIVHGLQAIPFVSKLAYANTRITYPELTDTNYLVTKVSQLA
jgi:hypothetical protein